MKRYLFAIIISVLALASCKKDVYYSLNVAASPTEGGTVSPSEGSFLAGDTVSIKATPSAEYLFEGWSGDAVGSSNPLSVVMDSDKSIVANFIKKSYSLAIEVEGCGHVEEKLLYTKSDYESGSSVELTAIPDEYWTFDHWEGDLSGNDNPKTIDVTSARSVKAVFVKPQYRLNVKTVGPGVVDEYLVETKAGLEAGTSVLLKAIPSYGGTFECWTGDINSSDPELNVRIDRKMNIVAKFRYTPLDFVNPDLYLPSCTRENLYYNVDFSKFDRPHFCMIDYNLDGYLDLVTAPDLLYSGETSHIGFYNGTADGVFVPDPLNDQKFLSLEYGARKMMTADFNGDGVPDIACVGHGFDEEPWPGDYPVILLSTPSGQYKELRVTDCVGYFHGSCCGDIDNDGDVDIVLVDSDPKSRILINDGHGNFTITSDLLDVNITNSMYTAELFDVNHDGYLDLLLAGHEHEGEQWHKYTNTILVIWGDGKSFNTGNYTRLPRHKDGYGVTLDIIFHDLDGDGQEEIISNRTGDGLSVKCYAGWSIQIVSYKDGKFIDTTSKFINNEDNSETTGANQDMISIEEVDGVYYLLGRKRNQASKLFKLNNGHLDRIHDHSGLEVRKHESGFVVYSDGAGTYGNGQDMGWTENPYAGTSCIRLHGWNSCDMAVCIDYDHGVDFSKLVEEGYSIEFAIKENDPQFGMWITFEARWEDAPTYPSYYIEVGPEHYRHSGEWEVISIPLSEFASDPEWQDGNYWDYMKTFYFMLWDCHGEDVFLDEVRFRKIADSD